MSERRAIVASGVGLHARPAALFTQAVAETGLAVTISNSSGKTVNAASILGVLTLGVDHGDTITIAAQGEGAEAALDKLVELLETDLGER